MAYQIDIVLDLTKKRAKVPRFVMEREVDAKQLNFIIMDNGFIVDISYQTITLCMEKPDGELIYNSITVSDGEAGECYIVLSSQCQAAIGTAKCWVKLVDGSSVTYSPKFEIEIMEVTDFSTAAESTSEFTDLDADIVHLAGFEARIGDQTYTEENYIADGQSITASLDALDIEVADQAGVGRTTEKLIHIGLIASLLTTAKNTLVAAINEIFGFITTLFANTASGWNQVTETFAYASASTITIAAGGAARWQKGDMLKFTQHGATKYFYVITVADTLLTVVGSTSAIVVENTATYPITAINYSRGGHPFGFPAYFTFTPAVTSEGGTPTTAASTFAYRIIGGLLSGSGAATVTDKGTATGGLRISTPVASAVLGSGSCREYNATGITGSSYIGESASFFTLTKHDLTTYWVNTYVIGFSIAYFI
jgi:hypothetical protein